MHGYQPDKIDKWTRSRLESAFRDRQNAALKAKGDELAAKLREVAIRRLKATYDEAQPDIPVLEKYGHATKVKGVNLVAYNPKSREPRAVTDNYEVPYPHNRTLGVPLEGFLDGYKVPSSGWGGAYPTIHVGGYAAGVGTKSGPYPAHQDHNSPDWQLLCDVLHLRDTYKAEQDQQMAEFKASIRSTSSWRKLVEMHPWLAEEFPPRPPTDNVSIAA